MGKHMNKPQGATSKRQNYKTKFKIQKKVRNHIKKRQKEAKNMKKQGLYVKKSKTVDQISNVFPFKAQVIEHEKEQQEELKLQRKMQRKGMKQMQIEEEEQNVLNQHTTLKELQLNCNVILQVVDIRAAIKNFYEFTPKMNQNHVLVLTKCDLVTQNNANQWVRYFASKLPTVVFSNVKHSYNQSLHTLLKKLSSEGGLQIGIIGHNNQGKKTLLNYLSSSKNVFGYTNILSTLQDDDQVLSFQNSQIQDTQKVFNQIFKLFDKKQILLQYKIKDFINSEEFVELVAKQNAKTCIQNGRINQKETYILIIKDWIQGKIKYQCEVPK